MVDHAEIESRRTRSDSDSYVIDSLKNLEREATQILGSVRKGIDSLSSAVPRVATGSPSPQESYVRCHETLPAMRLLGGFRFAGFQIPERPDATTVVYNEVVTSGNPQLAAKRQE